MPELSTGRLPAESDLEVLADATVFGRYAEDQTLERSGVRRLILDGLRDLLGRPAMRFATARNSAGEIEGLLAFRLSSWDSEHFGFPYAIVESLAVVPKNGPRRGEIARNLFEEYDRWARKEGVCFTCLRVPSMDLALTAAAESSGFNFVESWIYNTRDITTEQVCTPSRGLLRTAVPSDKDAMLRFSREAFAIQRFHADQRFDREKADSLYRKWIETSFTDNGQRIAAWDIDGAPRAFVAYRHLDLTATIGRRFAMWNMALLDPDYRGRGFGTEFFQALVSHHRGEGVDSIDSGVSLRNLKSLNLHNKCRFRIVASLGTFHRWEVP